MLQRATLVHCKGQAEIHLFSALFEERHGDVEAARTAYALVQVCCMTSLWPDHGNDPAHSRSFVAQSSVAEWWMVSSQVSSMHGSLLKVSADETRSHRLASSIELPLRGV